MEWTQLEGGWQCSPDSALFYHHGSKTYLERATGSYYRQGPTGELEPVGDVATAHPELHADASGAWERKRALEGPKRGAGGQGSKRARHTAWSESEQFEERLKLLKLRELQQQCRERGLITVGKKRDLIARLSRAREEDKLQGPLHANQGVPHEGVGYELGPAGVPAAHAGAGFGRGLTAQGDAAGQ